MALIAGVPAKTDALHILHRPVDGKSTGGPGTGKTHVATSVGIQAVEHHSKQIRFFSAVELVNAPEQEKAGQIAEVLIRRSRDPRRVQPSALQQPPAVRCSTGPHRCHILKTGNDGFRFRAASAARGRKRRRAATS